MTLLEPVFDPRSYNFAATNGVGASGNLSAAGAGKVITFVRLPFGLRVGNYIYLSGGSGTAEAVPLTAISGTAGGAGTATVTTGNTHTGAWIASSSSSGIQEAVIATGGNGKVRIPAGTFNLYAGVTIPGTYQISLRGAGVYVTFLNCVGTTGDWIVFDTGASAGVDFGSLFIHNSTGTQHTSGVMVKIVNRPYGLVSDLFINDAYDGLKVDSNVNVFYSHILIGCKHYGLWVMSTGSQSTGSYDDILISTNGAAGTTAYRIDGPTAGVSFTACGCGAAINDPLNYGVYINQTAAGAVNELNFSNCIIDGHGTTVAINGYGSYVNNSIIFTGCRMNARYYGMNVSGSISGVRLIGCTLYGDTAGVLFGDVTNSLIVGCHLNAVTAGLNFSGGTVSHTVVRSNVIGRDNLPQYGIALAGTLVNVQIGSNDISGSIAPFLFTTTTGYLLDGNNVGFDTLTGTVADAATLAFPQNAFFTLTGTGTAITAVTGLWAGRRGTFIATNASPPQLIAGTTIGNTFTPTQNKLVTYFSPDGIKVYSS